ncbi:hypothetical protein B0H16DRAFT_952500 [Mycena metata]|uniref:Uncharacterized protein n=1 Tax=Mycena metata TaxID=1033252 RepID=A0AAD7K324_9AGAR|nr:hypothetical protein B0H16DRAFT_952500 [Mycena metata]
MPMLSGWSEPSKREISVVETNLADPGLSIRICTRPSCNREVPQMQKQLKTCERCRERSKQEKARKKERDLAKKRSQLQEITAKQTEQATLWKDTEGGTPVEGHAKRTNGTANPKTSQKCVEEKRRAASAKPADENVNPIHANATKPITTEDTTQHSIQHATCVAPFCASTSCSSIDTMFRALLDEHERQLRAKPVPSLKFTTKTGENALQDGLDELSDLLCVAREVSISGAATKRKREEEFDLNLPRGSHAAATPHKRLRPTPQSEPILGFQDLVTNSAPAAKEMVSKLAASLIQAAMFNPFTLRRDTSNLPLRYKIPERRCQRSTEVTLHPASEFPSPLPFK